MLHHRVKQEAGKLVNRKKLDSLICESSELTLEFAISSSLQFSLQTPCALLMRREDLNGTACLFIFYCLSVQSRMDVRNKIVQCTNKQFWVWFVNCRK